MASLISRRGLGVALAIIPAACATAQTAATSEAAPALHQRLTPIARFVGLWRGTTEGEPGRGAVERTYTPILNGRFIEERNTSTYPPARFLRQ